MTYKITVQGDRIVATPTWPTFVSQTVSTPGLTRLEQWLTTRWPCMLWTGGLGCPCLRRWCLLTTSRGKLFLHRFFADDWSLDLHDHSGHMISMGLWGAYEEETPQGKYVWRAPWIRRFPATWIHRLRLRTRVVWTLVWIGPKVRPSGFWYQGHWWSQDRYLKGPGPSRTRC